jgi:predicted HAD superfamily Cof-like phosphohydrolase
MSLSNFQRTANWLHNCGKESNKLNAEAISVQIGCHIEEVCELLDTLSVSKEGYARLLQRCVIDLNALALKLKTGGVIAYIPEHLRVDVLDALCDAEVTGNGIAYLAELDKDAADEAVIASNEAKLVDGKPVILPGGKIGKPQGWMPPNLRPYV